MRLYICFAPIPSKSKLENVNKISQLVGFGAEVLSDPNLEMGFSR